MPATTRGSIKGPLPSRLIERTRQIIDQLVKDSITELCRREGMEAGRDTARAGAQHEVKDPAAGSPGAKEVVPELCTTMKAEDATDTLQLALTCQL